MTDVSRTVFQGWSEIGPGRLPGRHQTKDDSGENRDDGRESEQAAIQRQIQVDGPRAVRYESHAKAANPFRKQQTRGPSEHGQENAFREQLPHEPGSSRAKRSEEHTSELQSLAYLVCRLLLEKKKKTRRRVDG